MRTGMMITSLPLPATTSLPRNRSRLLQWTIFQALTATLVFLRENIYEYIFFIARSTIKLGNIYPRYCQPDNKQNKKIPYVDH